MEDKTLNRVKSGQTGSIEEKIIGDLSEPLRKELLSEKLFLDSELMRPFIDELCKANGEKSRTSIVSDILSKVQDTHPDPENDPGQEAPEEPPEVIIANWLFVVGSAKNRENTAIQDAKRRLKKETDMATSRFCTQIKLSPPNRLEALASDLMTVLRQHMEGN